MGYGKKCYSIVFTVAEQNQEESYVRVIPGTDLKKKSLGIFLMMSHLSTSCSMLF